MLARSPAPPASPDVWCVQLAADWRRPRTHCGAADRTSERASPAPPAPPTNIGVINTRSGIYSMRTRPSREQGATGERRDKWSRYPLLVPPGARRACACRPQKRRRRPAELWRAEASPRMWIVLLNGGIVAQPREGSEPPAEVGMGDHPDAGGADAAAAGEETAEGGGGPAADAVEGDAVEGDAGGDDGEEGGTAGGRRTLSDSVAARHCDRKEETPAEVGQRTKAKATVWMKLREKRTLAAEPLQVGSRNAEMRAERRGHYPMGHGTRTGTRASTSSPPSSFCAAAEMEESDDDAAVDAAAVDDGEDVDEGEEEAGRLRSLRVRGGGVAWRPPRAGAVPPAALPPPPPPAEGGASPPLHCTVAPRAGRVPGGPAPRRSAPATAWWCGGAAAVCVVDLPPPVGMERCALGIPARALRPAA
eukprot:gene53399-14883_t